MNPENVTSPAERWELLRVIRNNGDWSAAYGLWDGDEVIAIRWNGQDGEKGQPVSRGYPVWFILPDELRQALEAGLCQLVNDPDVK